MTAFDRASALGSREAVAGKGCLMLTLGDFEQGLEGYEARWLAGKSLSEALGTRFETWKGPGRRGKRVLVLNDHGLGDTIQFFRYLPLMAAAGVEPTFVCPPRLRRLLSSKAKAQFTDAPPRGEPFDAQIAISSLPHAFGTRLETIPAAVPYLSAEPRLREMWFKRIGAGRLQGRHRLARQPQSGGRSRPLHATHRARAICHGRGRETHLAAERGRRGAACQSAALVSGRNAGRRLRRGSRRIR